MGISGTEIQTNLRICRACCNQNQQYSPLIIIGMWLMFNEMAEICVAFLDDRRFVCVFTVIFIKWSQIFFKIFTTFSRYLKKINSRCLEEKSGISGNIFRRFFEIFVSRPIPLLTFFYLLSSQSIPRGLPRAATKFGDHYDFKLKHEV